MSKTIAIVNEKGGVGKTTIAISLGSYLASTGKKVLICDCDKQKNATMAAGLRDLPPECKGIPELIVSAANGEQIDDLSQFIHHTEIGPDVIPANDRMTALDLVLVDKIGRELFLKNALKKAQDEYDYIFIDCPPHIGIVTINALAAADEVLIPTTPTYFSESGIATLFATIGNIRQAINPDLKILGVLITLVNNTRVHRRRKEEIRVALEGKVYVFRTEIPFSIRMEEAIERGIPIYKYKPDHILAERIEQLSREVISREHWN